DQPWLAIAPSEANHPHCRLSPLPSSAPRRPGEGKGAPPTRHSANRRAGRPEMVEVEGVTTCDRRRRYHRLRLSRKFAHRPWVHQPHCVATTVTFSVVFASEETPGPDGLTIKLFPEIVKTP